MCDNILSKRPSAEPISSIKGFEINKFYGRKKTMHLDIDHLRRKQRLHSVEKYVSSRKSADALALRNYNKRQNCCKKSNITSHSTKYSIFGKQEDAVRFSHEKVYVLIFSYITNRGQLSVPTVKIQIDINTIFTVQR